MSVITSPFRRMAAFLRRPLGRVALITVLGTASLRAEVSKEYQLKAGFLYNFTKFIEWPSGRLADKNAPLVIAVLGKNPFGEELQQVVSGRKVNGREILVQNVGSIGEAKQAHVLFVGAGDEKRLPDNLDSFNARGVLTVGESERFAALGGIIVFTLVDNKVRFEVNIASAERSGLKVSAQLLKLATHIRRKP